MLDSNVLGSHTTISHSWTFSLSFWRQRTKNRTRCRTRGDHEGRRKRGEKGEGRQKRLYKERRERKGAGKGKGQREAPSKQREQHQHRKGGEARKQQPSRGVDRRSSLCGRRIQEEGDGAAENRSNRTQVCWEFIFRPDLMLCAGKHTVKNFKKELLRKDYDLLLNSCFSFGNICKRSRSSRCLGTYWVLKCCWFVDLVGLFYSYIIIIWFLFCNDEFVFVGWLEAGRFLWLNS